ncbi:hypothetical protein IMZ48_32350 [Candidatus Bathyarchaeota archaeon]|nr:hypothetical protein [Candidatus Bathyarchaeota archaeon]
MEIGDQIWSLLCLHCQDPEAFPHADSPDVRLNKASLSRLARTSKRMYDIVQPFVYHYYATGNLPVKIANGIEKDSTTYPSDDDKLPAFLRTVIQRPDLAAHATALQLVASENLRGCTADVLPVLTAASEVVGLSYGLRIVESLQKDESAPYTHPLTYYDAHKREEFRTGVHKWLEELTILLLPNIERLSITRDYIAEYFHLEESGRQLPALRTVALMGWYHVHEPMALFAAAPRLETLYAIGACALFDNNCWTEYGPWSLKLAGLRKLTVTDLKPLKDLELLLECCHALSELHFSHVHLHDYWDAAQLMLSLAPVKGQLRHLTLTWVPINYDSDPEEPDPYSYEWTLEYGKQHDTVDSFREFVNLEVLVIDQAALCQREDRLIPSDRLVNFLPASIREVHFYFVYRSFLAALETLAYEAPRRFPHLRVVHISLADRIEVHRVKELEDMRCFTRIAREVGIEVRWGTTQIGGLPWAAVRGLCPASDVTPFFSSYKISSYKRDVD